MLTKEQYEEKRQARYDRLLAASQKAQNEASHLVAQAHDMASGIPFGQPILIGHHSEGRDRRYRSRIENKFRKGFDLYEKSEELKSRATSAAGNDAIYSDDPTATEQIADKITALEAKQELMKATNKAIKKNDCAALLALGYTDEEATNWLTKPLPFVYGLGYPAYAITNNGANIRRLKERAQVVGRKQAAEDKSEEIDGVKVEYSPSENRVRVYYPGRVPLETYKALKQHGFRVLRSEGEGAFSAYYNNNALCFVKVYIKKES